MQLVWQNTVRWKGYHTLPSTTIKATVESQILINNKYNRHHIHITSLPFYTHVVPPGYSLPGPEFLSKKSSLHVFPSTSANKSIPVLQRGFCWIPGKIIIHIIGVPSNAVTPINVQRFDLVKYFSFGFVPTGHIYFSPPPTTLSPFWLVSNPTSSIQSIMSGWETVCATVQLKESFSASIVLPLLFNQTDLGSVLPPLHIPSHRQFCVHLCKVLVYFPVGTTQFKLLNFFCNYLIRVPFLEVKPILIPNLTEVLFRNSVSVDLLPLEKMYLMKKVYSKESGGLQCNSYV